MQSVRWRVIAEQDLAEPAALDRACLAADGPASVPALAYSELLADPGVATLCAIDAAGDGRIIAAGWVRRSGAQAMLGGKVHPAHRRQTLGTHLLRWAETAAGAAGAPTALMIRNETLNAGSTALYAREGYTCDFVETWMQRDLREPLPAVAPALLCVPWTPASAPQFFAAYVAAFSTRRRPGAVLPDLEKWIGEYVEDPEFRPDVSRLALAGGEPVGFITTGVLPVADLDQTVGWISQVGTRPDWRGRGIAAGLIAAVLADFRREGFAAVGLHVNVDNPGARKVYADLGFRQMGQRGKYSKLTAE